MGRPSDKRRAARRIGKRERARVKKGRRGETCGYVGGAIRYRVKAGKAKHGKVMGYIQRLVAAHLGGDSVTLKSGEEIKRPLYTISSAIQSPPHEATGAG